RGWGGGQARPRPRLGTRPDPGRRARWRRPPGGPDRGQLLELHVSRLGASVSRPSAIRDAQRARRAPGSDGDAHFVATAWTRAGRRTGCPGPRPGLNSLAWIADTRLELVW